MIRHIHDMTGVRKSRRSSVSFALNITPLMDIMFNLLVFFMVATSFKLPEGLLQSRLPRTTGITTSQTLPVPIVPIKVFLEPDDGDRQETFIRVSTSLRNDAASLKIVRTFEELFALLETMRSSPGITPQTPVIIAAKPQTPWNQVVDAYNASLRAEYTNVVFASWK